MALTLGLLIFSFIITSILVIPFIDFLYRLKFQRKRQETKDALGRRTPIFDRFHRAKAGTPIGGGLLIILVVSLLYAFLFPLISFLGVYISSCFPIKEELNILFFTFLSFGLLCFMYFFFITGLASSCFNIFFQSLAVIFIK